MEPVPTEASSVDQNSSDIENDTSDTPSTPRSDDVTPGVSPAAFENSKGVKIMVKNRVFKAHGYKLVLSGIPYFVEPFEKPETKIITIKEDVAPEAVQAILKYVYERDIVNEMTSDNVFSILKTAKFLKAESIITECQEFIKNLMRNDFEGISQKDGSLDLDIGLLKNILSSPVSQVNAQSLFDFIIKWVTHDYQNRKNHLGELVGLIKISDLSAGCIKCHLYQEDVFRNLDTESLENVLSIDELKEDATMTLNGIIEWVTHDYENRNNHLARLLNFIEMSDLSADYINHYLYHEENEAIGYNFPTLAYELHSRQFQSMIRKTEHKLIIVIGLSSTKTPIVEYDPKTQKWSDVGKTDWCTFCSVTVHDGKLYKFRGLENNKIDVKSSRVVEVYDIDTKTWQTLNPMNTPRKECGAVYFKNFLYACGGNISKEETTNTVERYSSESKQWELISPMKERRCAHAVILFKDRIYAIGGAQLVKNKNYDYSDTVEVYDFKTKEWSILEARMAVKRSSCGAAVLNGKIYVCGGWNGKALDIVEMFDPKLKRWKTVKNMNKARKKFLVVGMGGKLLAIGGCSKEDQLQAMSDSLVEVYDPHTNDWSYVKTRYSNLKMHLTGGIIEGKKLTNHLREVINHSSNGQ